MLCVILYCLSLLYLFFFFNDTPTTEIYTLSLHDALPISNGLPKGIIQVDVAIAASRPSRLYASVATNERSEEHTSELQSRGHLVCRLLLEKKKKKKNRIETRKQNK